MRGIRCCVGDTALATRQRMLALFLTNKSNNGGDVPLPQKAGADRRPEV